MTEDQKRSYVLSLPRATLEFRLDLQASLDYSRRFEHHGVGFVFAVVEVWLQALSEPALVLPATNPGNFIEELRDLRERMAAPPSMPAGLEQIVPRGGWSEWMAGYWGRVQAESSLQNDEEIYERLSPLSFGQSNLGKIAVYQHGDMPVLEVSVEFGSADACGGVVVWSQFDPEVQARQLQTIANEMESDVRALVK